MAKHERRGLLGIILIAVLLTLPGLCSAAGVFSCTEVRNLIDKGYYGIKFMLDTANPEVEAMTCQVNASAELTLYSGYSSLEMNGSQCRMTGKKAVITYQFDPASAGGLSIRVSNITVWYTGGRQESLGSMTFYVSPGLPHEHAFVFSSVRQEASCVRHRIEEWRCECGEAEEREIAGLGPHAPDPEWTKVTPAGCLEDGCRERACTLCPAVVETETIPARGYHREAAEWEMIRPADCRNTGEQVKRCLDCGEVLQTETLPVSGTHAPEETWRKETAATCAAQGSEILCCRICEAVLSRRATASLSHTPAAGWETETEPGCEQTGTAHLRCTECGQPLETRGIAALGHDYSPWEADGNGLCTQAREESRKCLRDGCAFLETRTATPFDSHDLAAAGETAASCVSSGVKKMKCSRCPYSEEVVTADPLGHSFGTWKVETPAT